MTGTLPDGATDRGPPPPYVCSMRFVVFGLTVSSSRGNGHATLWRGLAELRRAFGARRVSTPPSSARGPSP